MRKFSFSIAVLVAVTRLAGAQGSSKADLAMAAAQAPAWDALGFTRFYDAARFSNPAGMVPIPETLYTQQAVSLPRQNATPRGLRILVVPFPTETPQYRRTFQALLSHPTKTTRFDTLILKYARIYRLDARLLKSIIAAESEFVVGALSPKGARGLMQVMPSTGEEMGVPRSRLAEPEYNIAAGSAYVAYLFKAAWRRYKLKGIVRYDEAPLWLKQRIIAAYNAGPRFLFRKGGWYRQTRSYVRKVLLFYHSRVTDFRRVA